MSWKLAAKTNPNTEHRGQQRQRWNRRRKPDLASLLGEFKTERRLKQCLIQLKLPQRLSLVRLQQSAAEQTRPCSMRHVVRKEGPSQLFK